MSKEHHPLERIVENNIVAVYCGRYIAKHVFEFCKTKAVHGYICGIHYQTDMNLSPDVNLETSSK